MRIYDETQPGNNYADTSVKEENTWTLLCRGFGTSKPKTNYDRLEFLLRLCGQYQRHDKMKRKLIQQRRAIGKTLMSVPFAEAAAMVEAIASSHDEVEAQMGRGREVNVDTVGTGTGLAKPCSICNKPGHAARDCMVFMIQANGDLWPLVHTLDRQVPDGLQVWGQLHAVSPPTKCGARG